MVSPNENARRAAALKKLVETPLAPGTTLIVVTHKPNIMNALGRDWFDVRERDVDLPARSGGSMLVARVKIEEWPGLAAAALRR